MTSTFPSPKPSNLATQDPATPMKGWVATSYRYYKGQKLGPYFVRRWKTGKKVHKEYIKAEDVERVRAACERHREIQRQMREGNEATNNYISNFNYLGRMGKHLEKERKQLRPEHLAYVLKLCKEGCFVRGRPSQRRVFVVPLPCRRSTSKFKRLFLKSARAAAKTAGFALKVNSCENAAVLHQPRDIREISAPHKERDFVVPPSIRRRFSNPKHIIFGTSQNTSHDRID